jgi:type IV secretion system protein VirD4
MSSRDRAALAVAKRYAAATGRCAGAMATAAAAEPFLTGDAPGWVAGVGLAATLTLAHTAARRAQRAGLVRPDRDALDEVRRDAARAGGGAFVGLDERAGGVVHAPAECAVLVLAPPRAGKTSGVIIPTVTSAPGAVLTTSTKPDVLMATARARSRFGRVLLFDPTGHASTGLPDGVVPLRWSPLEAAGPWESARRIAQAMVYASPAAKGTRHESHWTSRSAALLGPLLHAAATAGLDMRTVISWVLSGEVDQPERILLDAACDGNRDALLAREVLQGVQRAATEERQSIWSATADVIDVYTTSPALDAASHPNFDPDQFVNSCDTVYIAAAAEQQASVAPLVVALIEAVRDAQYRRHRAAAVAGDHPGTPVSLVLDEVANVAPIHSLPALVSEAGGQGLHVVAALQDLSQVRSRWGAEIAEGFLSLFQHVLALGGIRDTRTLEALSVICGEWDRPHTSTATSSSRKAWTIWPWERTRSTSTTHSHIRQRRLVPGQIYALPPGRALYLSGSGWRTIRLAPHYTHPRWQAALAAAPTQIKTWPAPPLPHRRPTLDHHVDPQPANTAGNGQRSGGPGLHRALRQLPAEPQPGPQRGPRLRHPRDLGGHGWTR